MHRSRFAAVARSNKTAVCQNHMHDGITMCAFIQVVKFDYGKQDENPIDKMRFYAKGDPDIAFKLPKEEVYILDLYVCA